MKKGARVTLTSRQAATPEGQELLGLIFSIVQDCEISYSEVCKLNAYLLSRRGDANAVSYLRTLTRQIVFNGRLDAVEAYELKVAFHRVVPKEYRGIISTHLEEIETPYGGRASRWRRDPITVAQQEYIARLGGKVVAGMTKGEASDLIESLLNRVLPTPRQVMLARFFDRADLISRTKIEVALWIDELFVQSPAMEASWERFKRESVFDPFSMDPSVVPIGAYRNYLI